MVKQPNTMPRPSTLTGITRYTVQYNDTHNIKTRKRRRKNKNFSQYTVFSRVRVVNFDGSTADESILCVRGGDAALRKSLLLGAWFIRA